MRTEVIAWSRHEHLVLYDPAAIPADTPIDKDFDAQEPVPVPVSAMEDLAAHGQALILRIACEDCQASIRVLVEELAESHIRERGIQVIDGANLRIPAGKLIVDGIEFLCRPGEVRRWSEAQPIAIPAGNYEVEVFNLMPWIALNREIEFKKKTTSIGRMVGKVVHAITCLSLLLFLAMAALTIFAVGSIIASGWEQASWMVWWAVLGDVVVYVGFWVMDIAGRRFPLLRQAGDAWSAFDAENPDVVICLRQTAGEGGGGTGRGMATLDFVARGQG